MRRAIIPAGFLFSLLAACLPPPAAMPLEGTMRQPVSSTTAVAYGGGGVVGFEDSSTGGGGGIRVMHQVTENFAFGGEGSTILFENGSPIFAGRIHGRYNPNTDALAFSLGVGGGFSEDNLQYATLDGGVRGSLYFAQNRLETYLGAGVGASISLTDSDSGINTLYGGGSLGTIYRPNEQLQFGIDVSLAVGDNELVDPFLTGGLTFNAAYHFGGKKAPSGTLAGLSKK